jgi:hypothetical protein
MTAPNLVGITTVTGRITGANLTTTDATSIVSNAPGSNKCFKINTVNACNWSSTTANITINYYSAAALGGTAYPIVSNLSVPANSTLTVIDKLNILFLEEDDSLGATAGTASTIVITASYEEIG